MSLTFTEKSLRCQKKTEPSANANMKGNRLHPTVRQRLPAYILHPQHQHWTNRKASLGFRRANCRSVLSATQYFLNKYLLTASGTGTAAGPAGPHGTHLCFVGVCMSEGGAFFSPPYTTRGKGIPDRAPRCCQKEQTQAGQHLSHLSAHLPKETSALLKEIKHLLFILYTSATGKGHPTS